jgi:hypothetical protein
MYDHAMSALDRSPECASSAEESCLTSGVLTSPADGLLRGAIEAALRAEPGARGDLFAQLLRDIEEFMSQHPEERPWTHAVFIGEDGSRIFRGGTGQSIVIDSGGTIWKARSYEDFDTTYDIRDNECRITSLTPHYERMRRYPLK